MGWQRVEIGDLLLIAEFNTGIRAEVLARNTHVMNLAAGTLSESDFVTFAVARITSPE
jgi:hypothetical protein